MKSYSKYAPHFYESPLKRFAATFLVLSWVLMGFSFAFIVPMLWDWFQEEGKNAHIWANSFAITLLSGAWLWARTRHTQKELAVRDGFLLVTLVWVVMPIYAAIPLWFLIDGASVADAYFEAMSGLTATGATTLSGLDFMPTSINIWRCFMQLIGGLGIMLLAVAILPLLGLGGTQAYKAETPGPMKDQRLTPRIAETARGLWGVYFVLSISCMLAYRAGGMSWSDAFMHMCTTVGLGGLSSHDASFGYWNSPQLEWTAIIFMALSGISFARYFMVWRQKSLAPLTSDTEVKIYAVVLLLASALVSAVLISNHYYQEQIDAVRAATFQVISLATTTGYATTNYLLWPAFVPVLLIFLGCFVSCAGSTGGGIKLIRMLVLAKLAERELVKIVHPHAVYPVAISRQIVPDNVIWAVMAFMLVYGGAMVFLTLILLASGLDVITAFTAILGCLNNIGPGMGYIGPADNFGVLTDFQIWICSFAMLLGRLELFSVLVLFTPQFWRR